MKVIQRCKKCILPTSLPSVRVDEDGICNHCNNYDRFMVQWDQEREERLKRWEVLVDQAKKRKQRYDVIIPLSGGKDSTYALYVCSKIYKMKCLCVTFDNGFLTTQARTNIQNALEASEADHLVLRISRTVLLKMYKTFLTRCGSFCSVCMRGIDESTETAKKSNNVSFVVTGVGRRVMYLSMLPELLQNGETRFFSKVAQGSSLESEAVRLGANWRSAKMPSILLRIENRLQRMRNSESHGIYDYLPVDRQEAQRVITSEMGWSKTGEHFEHTDCALHPVVGYIHRLRFPELTAQTAHLSGQIRMKELSRDEALRVDEEMMSGAEIPEALIGFLDQLGMSKDEFDHHALNWRAALQYRT